MSITTTAHLNFRGQARAALEFYQSVFGGDLAVVTYGDAGNAEDPAAADQVLWGQVLGGTGIHVMAFDVPTRVPFEQGTNSYFVSVRSADQAEITGYWHDLVDGGTVVADLAPSGWAPLYGMLRDKFGVVWVLDVAATYGDS
jgi:PhnB protein